MKTSIFSLFVALLFCTYSFGEASVKGHLVNKQGEGLAYAYIILKNAQGDINRVEDADSDGNFFITGIPEGKYRVEAAYFNMETYQSEVFQITSKMVDLGEIPLDPVPGLEPTIIVSRPVQSSIVGQLKDDTGDALSFAQVIIKNEAGDIVVVKDSEEDGFFNIDKLPLGKYRVEVNYFGLETYQSEILNLEIDKLNMGKIQLQTTKAAKENPIVPTDKIRA